MTGARKIIITRPKRDADLFAEQIIQQIGRVDRNEIIFSPVLDITPATIIPCLDRVTAFAFTSANGVRALAPHLTGVHLSMPSFVVGPASAQAARDAGFSTVFEAGGDVDSLTSLIVHHAPKIPECMVYHGAGSVIRGNLVGTLRARKIAARHEAIYQADPLPGLSAGAHQALSSSFSGGPEIIVTLFSPRSGRLFCEQVGKAGLSKQLANCHAYCLSEAVEQSVTGFDAVKIATAQTMNALIDLLKP